jgi:hypothetical protein
MNAIAVGIITFVCVFGGAVAGMFLRRFIPEHHLTVDAKDAIKMGAGLIATLSALVLGLLVNSAKNSFDDMNDSIIQTSAKVIMLDRAMARYGPQTQPIREILQHTVIAILNMSQQKKQTTADKEGRGRRRADLKAENWLWGKYKELKLDQPGALKPLVMGRHLISLGIKPGKEIASKGKFDEVSLAFVPFCGERFTDSNCVGFVSFARQRACC